LDILLALFNFELHFGGPNEPLLLVCLNHFLAIKVPFVQDELPLMPIAIINQGRIKFRVLA
jgi:hypothetical protein